MLQSKNVTRGLHRYCGFFTPPARGCLKKVIKKKVILAQEVKTKNISKFVTIIKPNGRKSICNKSSKASAIHNLVWLSFLSRLFCEAFISLSAFFYVSCNIFWDYYTRRAGASSHSSSGVMSTSVIFVFFCIFCWFIPNKEKYDVFYLFEQTTILSRLSEKLALSAMAFCAKRLVVSKIPDGTEA